jgi:hypothetical protein
MKRLLLSPVLLFLLLTNPAFAENYLCIADMATGFRYNQGDKSWEGSGFRVKDSRYLISPLKNNAAYHVKRFGGTDVMSRCKEGFNEVGNLFCKGTFDISFNKNNGRFVLTHTFGYFNVLPDSKSDSELIRKSDQESATPFIEIGMCSPTQVAS